MIMQIGFMTILIECCRRGMCVFLLLLGCNNFNTTFSQVELININSSCSDSSFLFIGLSNNLILKFEDKIDLNEIEVIFPKEYLVHTSQALKSSFKFDVWPIGPFEKFRDTILIFKNGKEHHKIAIELRYSVEMSVKFHNTLPNDSIKVNLKAINTKDFLIFDPNSCYLHDSRVISYELTIINSKGQTIFEFEFKDYHKPDIDLYELSDTLTQGDQIIFESVVVTSNYGIARDIGRHVYYVHW